MFPEQFFKYDSSKTNTRIILPLAAKKHLLQPVWKNLSTDRGITVALFLFFISTTFSMWIIFHSSVVSFSSPFFPFIFPTQLSFLFVNRTIQKRELPITVERQEGKEWIESREFELFPFMKLALGLCSFWSSLCKAHDCLFGSLCLPTNFSSPVWKYHHSSNPRVWFAYSAESGLTKFGRITFLVLILFLIAAPLAFLWLQSSWHNYENVTPYCFAVSD